MRPRLKKPSKNGKNRDESTPLATTVEDEQEQTAVETKPKPKKNDLTHSYDKAFTSQEMINNLRYVVETGDNPLDLLMRTNLPSHRPESYRLMVAFSVRLKKCLKYHHQLGFDEIRNMLAMLPSLDGRSREQLIKAITGGYFGEESEGGQSGLDKLRKMAMGR